MATPKSLKSKVRVIVVSENDSQAGLARDYRANNRMNEPRLTNTIPNGFRLDRVECERKGEWQATAQGPVQVPPAKLEDTQGHRFTIALGSDIQLGGETALAAAQSLGFWVLPL